MDTRFLPHNTHMEDPARFPERDPHLRNLKQFPLVYTSPLLSRLPGRVPGIYSLTGGRQIGKTTLIKQWMARLLQERVSPERIVYFSGELIDDHHSLVRLLSEAVDSMPPKGLCYLILDEVTYIRDWDKGVKFLADAGLFERVALVITGSDMVVIKESRARFPGRRGLADQVDFQMYPLSFSEFVSLNGRLESDDIRLSVTSSQDPDEGCLDILYEEFESYLAHGGYLTAINDLAMHRRILPATFSTYSDWIRGDVLKRNKQEHYLKEILEAIAKRYCSQVTWNALARDLSIDHPKTVSDYVALLESMDAAFVQPALQEHKLGPSPKKPRKLMFSDPFIFHAVRAWLNPSKAPYEEQVQPLLSDPEWSARLVESIVATHYRRRFPTYYIKAEGEVDVAYVEGKRFRPVEVKWTGQLRPKEIKQIQKYGNALILTKTRHRGEVMGIPSIPVPVALMSITEL
ncbi:MAG: ATP-binding protein [Deltaproteobacteria bacterium]|nr:ATP-binding protein [Deltaproteobacteria bacterium]